MVTLNLDLASIALNLRQTVEKRFALIYLETLGTNWRSPVSFQHFVVFLRETSNLTFRHSMLFCPTKQCRCFVIRHFASRHFVPHSKLIGKNLALRI